MNYLNLHTELQRMHQKKLLIFDFDGTLADTLLIGVNISNKLAERFKYRKLNIKELEDYRNKTAQEVLKEAKIPFFKMPFIIASFRKEYKKQSAIIQPFDNIINVLNQLNNHYSLGILTSNSQTTVHNFLKKNKIFNLFDFIYTEAGLFNKNKRLRRIINQKKLEKSEIIFISDETRDIEASKKVGIDILAVSWGYNSKNILNKFSPNYIANNPIELLNFFI